MFDGHPLDNPAWSSLGTCHRHLGAVGERAALYDPRVSMIGTVAEETDEAFAELAGLARPGVPVALVGFRAPEDHPDWAVIREAEVRQMTRREPVDYTAVELVPLGETDVPQMLELVELTRPGPFSPGTIEMGRYVGHWIDGMLVAMGGERMRPSGYVELSAICVHPEFRGRGIAKAITGELTNNVLERGLLPFLHVGVGNTGALKLYEGLGYEYRRNVPGAAMIRKPPVK